MNDIRIIDLTPENIADYGVCGYKNLKKHLELRKKIDWFKDYYPKGLRIKAVISEEFGYQGMIEYIPGKYAHRPVEADGYLFIHCIFVGFKKETKGKGYGSLLLKECIKEAKDKRMSGVAAVTRKGSFMADDGLFLKHGFQVVDQAEPDFCLLVNKFDEKSANPSFKPDLKADLLKYGQGLTILRSAQCPYTEKNVRAILDSARTKFKLKTSLVDLEDARAAQENPSVFGSFCLILDGQVLSHHPISNGRFENIMKKMKKMNK